MQVTGGFMWQGFGSRGANISFHVCHQWGSQQCQEARGSGHLWLHRVKSRNIELWSSNSPPHLDFVERRGKKQTITYPKKHRWTWIFWTCSFFLLLPCFILQTSEGLASRISFFSHHWFFHFTLWVILGPKTSFPFSVLICLQTIQLTFCACLLYFASWPCLFLTFLTSHGYPALSCQFLHWQSKLTPAMYLTFFSLFLSFWFL